MSPCVKKILLLLLAAAMLFGSGRIQSALNRDRERLGLTHVDPWRTPRRCWRSPRSRSAVFAV